MRLPFLLLLALLILLPSGFLFAEETDDDPLPYSELEFPKWSRDLRRGEVIFFGSIPFTLLGTSIIYRTVDYFVELGKPGGGGAAWGNISTDDRLNILYITLGISAAIAIVDYIIGLAQEDKQE